MKEQLDYLANQWLAIKDEEKKSQERRILIESEIIRLLSFNKIEGSETKKTNEHKVTMTARLNRKLDTDAWDKVCELIPEDMRPVEEVVTYKVIDAGVRYLQNNEPEIYRQMAHCIIATPQKTAVTVSAI